MLRHLTGAPTIPQIFIGGVLVGGCTDLLDGFRNGELARQFAATGIVVEIPRDLDPYTLLPAWMHPRESEQRHVEAEPVRSSA